MTTVEIGQAAARCRLSLADAMRDALRGRQEDQESRLPIRRGHDVAYADTGIRFQRCGGGRRVIRRQRGAY